jgi:hypothetical protein
MKPAWAEMVVELYDMSPGSAAFDALFVELYLMAQSAIDHDEKELKQ